MGKLITSFSLGFAAATVVGIALFGVMRPAHAHDEHLSDWIQMSPEAKLAHASQVAGSGPGRMERAREILYCLHDAAKSQQDAAERTDVNLTAAIAVCRRA